jgi:hypothetical protein
MFQNLWKFCDINLTFIWVICKKNRLKFFLNDQVIDGHSTWLKKKLCFSSFLGKQEETNSCDLKQCPTFSMDEYGWKQEP